MDVPFLRYMTEKELRLFLKARLQEAWTELEIRGEAANGQEVVALIPSPARGSAIPAASPVSRIRSLSKGAARVMTGIRNPWRSRRSAGAMPRAAAAPAGLPSITATSPALPKEG